jgi:hypothetical protein
MASKDAAKGRQKKDEQINWGLVLATGLLQCYPERAVEYLRLAVGVVKGRRKAVKP